MEGLCHTLEEVHIAVVQPMGLSSFLRLRLPRGLDAATTGLLMRATAQRPVRVHFELGAWHADEGLFDCPHAAPAG